MAVRAYDVALNQPWAMQQEALQTLLAVAAREGNPEAVQVAAGQKLAQTRQVSVRDGVALVPVLGPLFRRANLFTEISGATSVETLARDLNQAVGSSEVKAILLDVDSPGGQANGIGELAAIIQAAGKQKPVHCYIGGLGASAAYWLACAAQTISLAPTALVGSIGVIAAYRRRSEEQLTFVSSQSPRKDTDPETDEGRADIQSLLDELAGVFIADVARYRGVTESVVQNDFGRGGVLVGKKAVAAGMADRVSSLEATLRRLARSPHSLERRERADTDVEGPPAGLSLAEEATTALAAVETLLGRMRGVRELRSQQGRALSETHRATLIDLHELLADLGTECLALAAPPVSATVQVLQRKALDERAAVERLLAGVNS